MNYGRFFEFDFESSMLDKGIAVFNYRWLQDCSDSSIDRLSPRYPVYLTFTSETIVFNLHYRSEDNQKKFHYHNPIIELYLSPNLEISDGLTDSLNETYYSEFPFIKNDFLRELIYTAYERNNPKPNEDYSSLDIFEIDSKDNYVKNGNIPSHFLRKIVLDFLYDFEFTGVFKNLAFYNQVSIRLKENKLFSALMNKLRYYYYRMYLIGNETIDVLYLDNTIDKDKRLQYLFQRYELAEKEWVASILSPCAMKEFHESPWFNECHEELEQVYSVGKLDKLRKEHKKYQNEKHGQTAKKILPVNDIPIIPDVSPHIYDRRLRFIKRNAIERGNTFGLTVSNLLGIIHQQQNKKSKQDEKNDFSSFGHSVYRHTETVREAAKWMVEHYRFGGLMKVWCGDKKTVRISFFFTALILGILWGLNLIVNKAFQDEPYLTGWKFIAIALIGSLLLWLLKEYMVRFLRNTWGQRLPSLLMPRMLAAIVAAWFTICMSEEMFVKMSKPDFNIPAIIIMMSLTLVFIAYESHALNPYDELKLHLKSAFAVFVLAYSYAFVTGVLIYDYFGYIFITNLEIEEIAKELLKYKFIYITQFSFMATFIGIFLQMMLQGVSITKSDQYNN